MRIAIFHDYIGAIGGGEKLVLTLARGLGADVITTDVDEDSVKKMGFEDVNIISLGETVKLPPLKQIYKRQGKPQTPGGAVCSGVFHENPAYN
ncbi:hypothetical protein ANME2D_02530 [Candidatus Methanoperedens nitroreducens]|uniref:Uncharacterized protein n=1 Tax=Candidatus Methanoperedens nitratireducens TaxID=1392998 RepID=A0A062V544_9EURY|nr:hypothetical protein [Candidatus Methanoperedens nitroreducens]KCZ70510.1 hypothetical protein ANME2D_02530 [Candidatus Methanoperedens nitroreducens]MDJ1420362.1 hypothetical protein [Candidatus Methanoperedens sp.]